MVRVQHGELLGVDLRALAQRQNTIARALVRGEQW
jgi:hypothetical protein